MRHYYVYMTASLTRVIYIGVTGNLDRRIVQHKEKVHEGFTSRYNVNRLVYWESFTDIHRAIAREKELKGWRREKKVALIEARNPAWKDLSAQWYGEFKKLEAETTALEEKMRARDSTEKRPG
ncbi:MAG TPA: GIY-YIG nuclease family protein [bacterium]|jgi:putative endonuclease